LGLSPDLIVCRSTLPLAASVKEKISLFCHVSPDNVISVHDVSNVYRVPLILQPQGMTDLILKRLGLFQTDITKKMNIDAWTKLADVADRLTNSTSPIHIALVGKYTDLSDAYLSVINSLQHAALAVEERVIIDWIEAAQLEPNSKEADPQAYEKSWKTLQEAHGILVPGGFGDRGVEGKILACNYARTKKIPYLGICLGLQIAVIEVARNVLGWKGANSTEFRDNAQPAVVIYMPEISKTQLGGTMRLGKRKTVFRDKDSIMYKLYGNQDVIEERHRHRYEVNPDLAAEIEKKSNLRFVAQDESG
jgi:CTP synthase